MKRALSVAMCTIAALSASATATVTTVEEGGTLALDASNANKDNTIIVAAAGSTISLAEWASGDKSKNFYPHLVVSGGVVRVSSSGWTRYRFVSGIRSVNGGSLVIEGASEISVDRKNIPTDTEIMASTGPLCDIDNVSFASGAGKLFLRYNVTARSLPANCPVEVLAGDSEVDSTIALGCANANAAAPLLVDNTLSLTNFNVIAINAEALPEGCHVKVSPGWTFMFDAYTLSADGFTLTPAAGSTGRYNIELLGRGAMVRFANTSPNSQGQNNNIRCESNITGLGEILFKPNSGTVITRFRGMAYQVSTSSSLSIPVDTANEPAQTESWKSKVSHWFDASDADTIVPFTYEPPSEWAGNWSGAKNEFNGNKIVIGWMDKVAESSISLYNARIWNNYNADVSKNTMKTDYVLQVMPYLVEGGLNGKNYLCFGTRGQNADGAKYDSTGNPAAASEGRRLRCFPSVDITGDAKASGSYTRFASQYCIMVFGSQQGGGRAIVGTDGGTVAANGYLIRNDGTSNCWAPRNGYSMHVDGLTADSKKATPNGGWQVVSIDMTATNTVVTGLGARDFSDSECGGQNYAEVIFFSEKPTVAERAACERYLAEKWGLEYSYVQWDNASSPVSGSSGSVILYDDARATYESVEEITAEGSFSGTVLIPEGKTLVIEKPLPPTEADVPDANRVGWFDPEFEGAVTYNATELGHGDLLYQLYGRTATGLLTGDNDLWFTSGWRGSSGVVSNFAPSVSTSVRGALTTGPARKWLVFKEAHGDILGNMIRSRKISTGVNGGLAGMNVRQGFFVTDTSSGGGDIFSTDATFSNGKIKPRSNGSVYSRPIWADGTTAMAGTWLDTTEIDGTERGYNGRPEVLSFATESETLKVGYVANYKGSHAEIVGEFIFYSQPLDDAARTKVQEYLMYKWFGDLNRKYADYSGATVIGAGTVKSPTLRNLPNFAAGFTGTVAGGSELSFTIGTDGVADALAINKPLVLDEGATVTVNVSGRPPAGHHTLLTATSISGSATLDIVGPLVNRKAKLHVDEGEIWLEITAPGMVVIVQ